MAKILAGYVTGVFPVNFSMGVICPFGILASKRVIVDVPASRIDFDDAHGMYGLNV